MVLDSELNVNVAGQQGNGAGEGEAKVAPLSSFFTQAVSAGSVIPVSVVERLSAIIQRSSADYRVVSVSSPDMASPAIAFVKGKFFVTMMVPSAGLPFTPREMHQNGRTIRVDQIPVDDHTEQAVAIIQKEIERETSKIAAEKAFFCLPLDIALNAEVGDDVLNVIVNTVVNLMNNVGSTDVLGIKTLLAASKSWSLTPIYDVQGDRQVTDVFGRPVHSDVVATLKLQPTSDKANTRRGGEEQPLVLSKVAAYVDLLFHPQQPKTTGINEATPGYIPVIVMSDFGAYSDRLLEDAATLWYGATSLLPLAANYNYTDVWRVGTKPSLGVLGYQWNCFRNDPKVAMGPIKVTTSSVADVAANEVTIRTFASNFFAKDPLLAVDLELGGRMTPFSRDMIEAAQNPGEAADVRLTNLLDKMLDYKLIPELNKFGKKSMFDGNGNPPLFVRMGVITGQNGEQADLRSLANYPALANRLGEHINEISKIAASLRPGGDDLESLDIQLNQLRAIDSSIDVTNAAYRVFLPLRSIEAFSRALKENRFGLFTNQYVAEDSGHGSFQYESLDGNSSAGSLTRGNQRDVSFRKGSY